MKGHAIRAGRACLLLFLVNAAFPAAAAVRFVDFEVPTATATFQPSSPTDYTLFDAEVRFSDGWRAAPGVRGTPSTTYFNFNGGGQVEIFFRIPVKNVSFTMYGYYNDSRAQAATIRYSSLPFDPVPHRLTPDPVLFYAPDKGPVTVTVPVDNIRYMTVGFVSTFSIDDFTYETTDDDQFVAFARFKTPGGSPSESGAKAAATMNVNIPLGTLFTVGLEKKQGFLDPVLPVTSAYTIATKAIAPAFTYFGEHLFTTSPVVDVGSTASSEERGFLAVHLGTVSIVIGPLSIPGPTVTMNITIIRPSALGTAENSWDKAIIDAAHERGIPPQMIKGQVAQESDGGSFKVDNFRYEPCSVDATYMSVGKTKINSSPYSLYALEGKRGTTLLDRTIALRNRYFIIDGVDPSGQSTRRHLITADTNITAKQIWDANNKWPPGGKHGINWSKRCATLNKYIATGGSLAHFSTDVLGFVAQTPTASSYGVMQVLYDTAIWHKWDVPDPTNPALVSSDPYYLLDTAENLQIDRGGSIPIGSNVDATHFPGNTNAFAKPDDLESIFDSVFQEYNPKHPGYGSAVIAHSHDYVPTQSGLVFN